MICKSWFRSSEQDSAKAKWTAAGVGPLQFRARGVAEGGRSATRDTSCARRKSHAAAARGDGVKEASSGVRRSRLECGRR
jgi:hypothetical protein